MAYADPSHRRSTEPILLAARSLMPRTPSFQNAPLIDTQRSPIQTVLVPLDGNLAAEHALPYAIAIARRSGALLRLVHVHSRLDHIEPWQAYYAQETLDRRLEAKKSYLLKVARRIDYVSAVQVETIVAESDDTEEALLQAAAAADLVVLASRRRSWWRRFFSHSVSASLRRSLGVPVLQVPGYSSPVDLTGNPVFRNILVPLDGSWRAERVLESVQPLSRLNQATITLLNLQDSDWTSGAFEHTTPQGYLVGVAREAVKQHPFVNARIMTTDRPPAAAIESYTEQEKVDLIALLTDSDRSWWRSVRGDVADTLLRRTNTPVLTLKVEEPPARPEMLDVVS